MCPLLPGMRERTIFLHGFSKAFAMTGWRVGYACGPHEIIDAMMKVHQYAIMCASTTAQEAALEALPQVDAAEVSLEDKQATLHLNAEVSDEAVRAAVEQAGYTVGK